MLCYLSKFFNLLLFVILLFCMDGQAMGKVFEVQGVSRPIYDAQLSFPVAGSLADIVVKAGQIVKKNDLLMSLDSRPEDTRISLLDYEIMNTLKIRTLNTKMAQAKLDMERYAGALKAKAATLMEVQHSKLTYNLTKLAIEEEKFRIEQLKRNREELIAQRERMHLYAPSDGYIEDILVERGMAVDRNVIILRLVDIDPLIVELTLPFEQVSLLHEGDEVEVMYPTTKETLRGTIMHIAKIAVLSNRTLKVRIHVPNPQGMPVGLMATVRFKNYKLNTTNQ